MQSFGCRHEEKEEGNEGVEEEKEGLQLLVAQLTDVTCELNNRLMSLAILSR